jgi:hypothetical protein
MMVVAETTSNSNMIDIETLLTRAAPIKIGPLR